MSTGGTCTTKSKSKGRKPQPLIFSVSSSAQESKMEKVVLVLGGLLVVSFVTRQIVKYKKKSKKR
ncbi:hypothetical protein Javan173_0054 [Streptococcus phage Javan173]|nr:hypothetical protein Javan173_0054 [Streptococcus phage Javan173]